MTDARIGFFLQLFLTLLVISVECNDFKFQSFNTNVELFNLEQLKNDLFSEIDRNRFSEYDFSNSKKSNNCLKELSEIKNGLINFEDWAIKSKIIFVLCDLFA